MTFGGENLMSKADFSSRYKGEGFDFEWIIEQADLIEKVPLILCNHISQSLLKWEKEEVWKVKKWNFEYA